MSRLDDMTRLHDQVIAGHSRRKSLVASLISGGVSRRVTVGATRAENQNANMARSRHLMATLAAFMAGLAAQEKGRLKLASRARRARVVFIGGVARNVASLAQDVASTRNANRAENAASRAAWCGVSVAAASGKRGGKSASHAA